MNPILLNVGQIRTNISEFPNDVLVAKARDSEYDQFLAWIAREALSCYTTVTETTHATTHCTSVRRTTHPHQNIVATPEPTVIIAE